jgi:hypothetical protein
MDEHANLESGSLCLPKEQGSRLSSLVKSGLTQVMSILEDPIFGPAIATHMDDSDRFDISDRSEIAALCSRILKAAGIDDARVKYFQARLSQSRPLTDSDLKMLSLPMGTKKKRR